MKKFTPEEQKAKRKEYYLRNKERMDLRSSEYQKRNRERINEKQNMRRAKNKLNQIKINPAILVKQLEEQLEEAKKNLLNLKNNLNNPFEMFQDLGL